MRNLLFSFLFVLIGATAVQAQSTFYTVPQLEEAMNGDRIIAFWTYLHKQGSSNLALKGIRLDSLFLAIDNNITGGGGGGGNYETLQEEGVDLTQRAKINFVGSSATAADDGANSRTNVTFDSDLNALADIATTGLYVITATGTSTTRTITAGTGISVSNGSGVSGNPTITNTGDLSATNELQIFTNSSDATNHYLVLSDGGGSIQFAEGSGITLTTTGTSDDGIVTIAATGGGSSNYQLLRDDGVDMTVRPNANFVSNGDILFSLDDDGPNNETEIEADIPAQGVDFTEIQNVSAGTLAGRSTAGSGSLEQITVSTGLSISGGNLTATDASATNEIQDLTITGASSPFTLDISGSANDINFAAGTGITLSESPANTLVITSSVTDTRANIKEANVLVITNPTATDFGAGFDVAIDATEGDINLDLSEVTEQVQDNAWNVLGGTQTGITVTYNDAGNNVSFVATDASATNEAWTADADDADTELITNQTVKFEGAGIVTTDYVPASDKFIITATEVDGSVTNELQTITNSSDATSHTVTLSNTGGSVKLAEGSGISLTTTGTGADGVVTIAATGGGASNYQLWRDDGVDATARPNANFVSNSDIAFTLTDDGANTETEVTADIPAQGVDFAEIQNVGTGTLAGRSTAGSGSLEQITVSTGLTISGGNLTANDASATNEAWTIDGDDADTEVISNQTVRFQGAGITTTDYNPATNILLITSNEVDGSNTNEVLTISDGTDSEALGGQTLTVTGASGITADYVPGTNTLTISGIGASAYQTVQEEGVGLTQRSIINFIGSTATAADNVSKTDVTFDSDVNALASIASTGLYTVTGTGTAVTRTITAGTGISVSNGSGVSGNPTITNTGDLSATNELQIFTSSSDATTHTLVLSDGGGSIQFVEGSGITLTTSGTSDDGILTIAATGGSGGNYQTIQEEGSGLTQRATFNFIGSGLTAADDAGNSRTNITVDSDLNALASNASTGVYVVTGVGTSATRTITAPAAGITISNGNGVSGNPTLALANDLNALEGLTGTGIGVRTGADTWTNRSVVAGTGSITVTNGDGVAGNITINNTDADQSTTNEVLTISDGTDSEALGGQTLTVTGAGGITADYVPGTNTLTITGAASGNYQTIQEEGSALTQRATFNFIGSSATAADDAPNTRTNITFDSDLNALASNATTGLYAITGVGTSATRTITGPAAGITVTNGNGVSGNPTLALANDLSALEALASTGLAVRTGSDTWTNRTITAGAGISVSNGDGVAGNPTITASITTAYSTVQEEGTGLTQRSIINFIGSAATASDNVTKTDVTFDSDLNALASNLTTGYYVITAAGTSVTRSITGPAAGIVVNNGNGVSGNTTLALSNDLAGLEGLGSTGLAVRSAADTWVQRSVVAGTGAITITNGNGVSGNITINNTDPDQSTTNELQTITNSSDATSHTVTLSNTGGSFKIVEGSNITLTTTGTGADGILTIASTSSGADGNGPYSGNGGNGGNGTVPSVTNSVITNQWTLQRTTDDVGTFVPFRIKVDAGNEPDFMSFVNGSDSILISKGDQEFQIEANRTLVIQSTELVYAIADSIILQGVPNAFDNEATLLFQSPSGAIVKAEGLDPDIIRQNGAADGDVLTWNNSTLNWEPQAPSGGGGGTPAGGNFQIQYYNSGAFGAEAGFEYSPTNNSLGVNGAPVSGFTIYSNGAIRADGGVVSRGTGTNPESDLVTPQMRLWNTTGGTGDTYYLASLNNGDFVLRSSNAGSNVLTVKDAGSGSQVQITNSLRIGTTTGTPVNMIGVNASGDVGTVNLGSGVVLDAGELPLWNSNDAGSVTSLTATALANVTGMTFAVTNGEKYEFWAAIKYSAQATTTGSAWSMDCPTGTIQMQVESGLTNSTTFNHWQNAENTLLASASSVYTTGNIAYVRGIYECTATGTCQLRGATEVGSSAITVQGVSNINWREIK